MLSKPRLPDHPAHEQALKDKRYYTGFMYVIPHGVATYHNRLCRRFKTAVPIRCIQDIVEVGGITLSTVPLVGRDPTLWYTNKGVPAHVISARIDPVLVPDTPGGVSILVHYPATVYDRSARDCEDTITAQTRKEFGLSTWMPSAARGYRPAQLVVVAMAAAAMETIDEQRSPGGYKFVERLTKQVESVHTCPVLDVAEMVQNAKAVLMEMALEQGVFSYVYPCAVASFLLTQPNFGAVPGYTDECGRVGVHTPIPRTVARKDVLKALKEADLGGDREAKQVKAVGLTFPGSSSIHCPPAYRFSPRQLRVSISNACAKHTAMYKHTEERVSRKRPPPAMPADDDMVAIATTRVHRARTMPSQEEEEEMDVAYTPSKSGAPHEVHKHALIAPCSTKQMLCFLAEDEVGEGVRTNTVVAGGASVTAHLQHTRGKARPSRTEDEHEMLIRGRQLTDMFKTFAEQCVARDQAGVMFNTAAAMSVISSRQHIVHSNTHTMLHHAADLCRIAAEFRDT